MLRSWPFQSSPSQEVSSVSLPSAIPFFFPHLLPVLSLVFHRFSSPYFSLFLPTFIWILLPLIDRFPTRPVPSLSSPAGYSLTHDPLFRLSVLLWPFLQFFRFVLFLQEFSYPMHPIRIISSLLSMTLLSAEGIIVSHELLHRRSRFERLLANLLLSSVAYGHFAVEHSRGHHDRVATPQDPASMRFGESFYTFLPRTLFGGFRSACVLERGRLQAEGLQVWSLKNDIVANGLFTIVVIFVVGLKWGALGIFLWIWQAITSVIFLEQINAIEHYGLERKRINGKWEKVNEKHSWDADYRLSNWFLFKLQVHADHHMSK